MASSSALALNPGVSSRVSGRASSDAERDDQPVIDHEQQPEDVAGQALALSAVLLEERASTRG